MLKNAKIYQENFNLLSCNFPLNSREQLSLNYEDNLIRFMQNLDINNKLLDNMLGFYWAGFMIYPST